MKKIIALLLALVMVIGLVACASSNDTTTDDQSAATDDVGESNTEETGEPEDSGESEPSEETNEAAPAAGDLNVAVFYYTYSDAFISSVRAALTTALDNAGIAHQDFDSNNNQATQNEQIQTALTTGCNLLVVNLVTSGSSDAAKAVIELAGDVPVIFFNRAVEADGEEGVVLSAYDNICFVGTDAPEAGHMQGQMIGEYLLANYDAVDLNGDGVISYALMKGEEANVEAIYRTQYGVEDANAVLTAAGKPELVYFDASSAQNYQVDQSGAWGAQAAVEYMNTNLSQYNEANGNMIELVICNNDDMAEGVVSALNAAGYNDGTGTTIPVFGVDATDSAKELINAGKMTGTVKQDAEGMANAILTVATTYSNGSSLTDGIAAAADSDADLYSVAEGIANKLYVAYAPFTA